MQTLLLQPPVHLGDLRVSQGRAPHDIEDRACALQDLADAMRHHRQLPPLVRLVPHPLRRGPLQHPHWLIVTAKRHVHEGCQDRALVAEGDVDGLGSHPCLMRDSPDGSRDVTLAEKQVASGLQNAQARLPRLLLPDRGFVAASALDVVHNYC